MARQVLENGVVLPSEYSDDWYDDMTSNLTKLDDVIGSDSEKLSSADVGAAALSNNYNDLDNLPTIPTVNDATLTIQKNGVDVQTFTANASSNVTCNITVPTKTSDLTNDSNFVDTSNSAVASGITSAKVTDYDTHIADTDIHVTASDKTNWNAVSSKANDSDVVHKSGDETVDGNKNFEGQLKLNAYSWVIRYKTQGTSNYTNYDTFKQIEYNKYNNIITLRRSADVLNSGDNFNVVDTSFAFYKIHVRSKYVDLVDNTRFLNDGTNNYVVPLTDNTTYFGSSSNKWKNVQTYNVNGVEPSSLSLPSGNASDVIDISSYITDMSGTSNSYTVPANGWISIAITGTAIDIVSSSWSDSRLRASSGNVRMLYPVLKNETLDISVIGTTLAYARFIPCQGNV